MESVIVFNEEKFSSLIMYVFMYLLDLYVTTVILCKLHWDTIRYHRQ